MAEAFTLDSLREEMEKKYAPLEITIGKAKVTLLPVLRLPKNDRKAIEGLAAQLDDEDGDTDKEDLIREILVHAGDKDRKLVDAIGDDVAFLMTVFNKWTELTQPGEASNSPA